MWNRRSTHTVSILAFLALGLACDKQADAPAPASASAQPAVQKVELRLLKVGDTAPSVPLALDDGTTKTLESLRGKYVVVYFYPQDDTPGCTVQAQGLRDSFKELQAFDVEVLGVSTQDAASHQAFIKKHELPFRLVVDNDGKVAEAFGVPMSGGRAARHTFLVGPSGNIEKIWRDVNPKEHAQAILDVVVSG